MEAVVENNYKPCSVVIYQIPLPVVENDDPSKSSVRYVWQKETKLVGYINMTIGSLGIVLVLIGTAGLIYAAFEMKEGRMFEDIVNPAEQNKFIALAAVTLMVSAGISSTEIYAGYILQKATSKAKNIHKRLCMCRTSRNINIIVLLLACTVLIPGYFSIFVWLFVKLRIFVLLMICKHIQELKKQAEAFKRTQLYNSQTVSGIN